MPTLTINKKEFLKIIKKKLSDKDIEEKISMMGVSIEKVDNKEITVEVFANRPDLLSEYGLGRAASTFLGTSKGLKNYKVKKSNITLKIDSSVKDIRPYTACCIVKNLKLNNEKIKEIIQIQEKLHVTYGRNRKKCAIGIYPLDKIKMPIIYKALEPNKIHFTPLESNEEMNGIEIIRDHPTGKEYGHLLKDYKKYPVFIDGNNKILSMPPIINSEETGRITLQTKEAFIECSGFEYNVVSKCLNIITTTLADMGAEIYSMTLNYGNKKIESPNLKPEEMRVDINYINKRIGLELKENEIKSLLEKMGYGIQKKGKNIIALIPSYRTDVIHQIDLVEDIAIAYGYDNIQEEIPKVATIAEEDKFDNFRNKVSEILVGLGLIETVTYNLTNKEQQTKFMNHQISVIELANALNQDYNVLRAWITPSLLNVLKTNKHNNYSQNIFGTGIVFKDDEKQETGIKERTRLGILLCNKIVTFTDIKQILDALAVALDFKYIIRDTEHGSFIPGRVGRINVNGKDIAYIGEIHPEVLNNFELEMPVAALEIHLTKLFETLK